MRTEVLVAAARNPSVSMDQLRDVLVLLINNREAMLEDEEAERLWRLRLPQWLLDKFAPTMTGEEKAQWLSRYEKASPRKREKLSRERGWELLNWLYWFQPSNEFWTMLSADYRDDRLVIGIETEDSPFPMSAVEWLCEVAGFDVADVVLVSQG